MAAGHVFFGMNRVDLIFDLVSLCGNSQQANAVDRTGGRAEVRYQHAELVPCQVPDVKEHEKGDEAKQNATHKEARGG